jgi:hypothetical protein
MASSNSAVAQRIGAAPHHVASNRRPDWLFPVGLFVAILAISVTLALIIDTPMPDLPASAADLINF